MKRRRTCHAIFSNMIERRNTTMQAKLRRPLATLLAAMMVIGLFAAFPLTASAATGAQLKTTIEGFAHGGEGELIVEVFTNPVNHQTFVNVTGSVTGVTNGLQLNIDAGVTVRWQANYSGSTSGELLYIESSGIFDVVSGGSLVNSGSGDTVWFRSGADFKVSGGTVSNTGTGRAIYATVDNAKITVSGGTVSAAHNNAIEVGGANSIIDISGGAVSGTGEATIYTHGEYTTLTVSGGNLSGEWSAICTGGSHSSVVVNGGTLSGGVSTIYSSGGDSTVTVSGGEVRNTEPYNPYTLDVAIQSSGSNSSVTIINGLVVGSILIESEGTLTIEGGFVFAGCGGIVGEFQVLDMVSGGPPSIGGTAVVCAWDNSSETTAYTGGSSDDLTVAPAGAAAVWGKEGSLSGVRYANGSNTGFFPIDGVTVSPAAFTVTFDSLGGSAVASLTVDPGASALRPENPEKEGFNFGGWFTNESFSALYDFDAPVTSDITLYAYWYESDPTPTPTPTLLPFPFTDVADGVWYRNAVEDAWRMGLIDGKTPTLYMPEDNLTYAEAVKLAACMHQLYTAGAVTLANATGGNPWYKTYVDYAKDNGIIDHDYEWGAPATRAGYIEIFANALPDEALPPMNAISNGPIPDVPYTHPQAAAIYKMYRAGILTGVDAAHNCNPDANIMRSEVATILVRMMDPDERVTFSM